MKIDWNLSETLIAKCKEIENLRNQGKTWDQISVDLKRTRAYLIALYGKYKEMKGGSVSAS